MKYQIRKCWVFYQWQLDISLYENALAAQFNLAWKSPTVLAICRKWDANSSRVELGRKL